MLTQSEKWSEMDAVLYGDLGTILERAGNGRGDTKTDIPISEMSVSMVAEAGFEVARGNLQEVPVRPLGRRVDIGSMDRAEGIEPSSRVLRHAALNTGRVSLTTEVQRKDDTWCRVLPLQSSHGLLVRTMGRGAGHFSIHECCGRDQLHWRPCTLPIFHSGFPFQHSCQPGGSLALPFPSPVGRMTSANRRSDLMCLGCA